MTAATRAIIPLPTGAIGAYGWELNRDETVSRVFYGETHASGAAEIAVVVEQSYDGEVLNCVGVLRVKHPGGDFDAAGLRELAAIALAAAEALEALLSDVDGSIQP
jgi:hypothetical protein